MAIMPSDALHTARLFPSIPVSSLLIPIMHCYSTSFCYFKLILLFREDIIFKDPLNTFVGIDNYKLIFGALRFCGQLFFKVLWVDIVSIWQPIENIIMIRWTVHGIARVPWESRGRFDGTSEYKLDRNGKIFEHKVDNVAINSPPKFRVLAVEEMIQSLGCPSTAKPTFFEATPSSIYSYVPTALRNSLARVYLAVCLILFCQCTSKGWPVYTTNQNKFCPCCKIHIMFLEHHHGCTFV